MKADAVLDPAWAVPSTEAASTPRHVLMTGATGFLGAHLLAELLQSGVELVTCLVRPPANRVAANLRHYGQWRDEYQERVQEVAGDLSQPRLGMSVDDYARLARDVDIVWNVGASVDIINAYEHHRPNNVNGANEIIRFASTQRTKRLHHVSSVVAIETPDNRGKQIEETHIPSLDDPGFVGYAHTKQVAETLVREAGARGLPINIYRCDNIAGSSQTGVSNPNDYFWRLFSGCVELGEVPELEYATRMVPADRAAQALTKLGVRGRPGQTYHITSSSLVPSSTVIVLERARAGVGQPERNQILEEHRRHLFRARDFVAHSGLFDQCPQGSRSPVRRVDAADDVVAELEVGLSNEKKTGDFPGLGCRHR